MLLIHWFKFGWNQRMDADVPKWASCGSVVSLRRQTTSSEAKSSFCITWLLLVWLLLLTLLLLLLLRCEWRRRIFSHVSLLRTFQSSWIEFERMKSIQFHLISTEFDYFVAFFGRWRRWISGRWLYFRIGTGAWFRKPILNGSFFLPTCWRRSCSDSGFNSGVHPLQWCWRRNAFAGFRYQRRHGSIHRSFRFLRFFPSGKFS